MIRKVGKPPKIGRPAVLNAIFKHKKDIALKNKKLVSKLDPVWGLISKDLDYQLKAGTLYALACRKDVRDKIFSAKSEVYDTDADDIILSGADNDANLSSSIEDVSIVEPDSILFTISANQTEFNNLIENKMYKRRDGIRGKEYSRQCAVLKPGVWEEWLTNEIWKTNKLKCAFNFHYARLVQDGTSGSISGTCCCKGSIKCAIDNHADTENNSVRIKCVVTRGIRGKKCGKRYLRAPMRKAIGEELRTKSAVVYRAEKADQMMQPGDPEPRHLYKKSALNNAKHETIKSEHLDPDPIRALLVMKLELLQNAIHSIGLDPFYVHYWTNHQLHVFREYTRRAAACIFIDATGGIVRSLEKCDGTKSSHIFLYHAVINNEAGQCSISQMLSERHTTVVISNWLAEWVSQAAVHPKEVVCDSSKALLTAAIRTFAGYRTIEEYANACVNSVLPACYVRIDVAHFIKMYADFLKNSAKRIKVFYLAVLGQFIQLRDIHAAKEMLRSILTTARCETDGYLPNGELTQCELLRGRLKDSINPSFEIDDKVSDAPAGLRPELESVFDDTQVDNFWYIWGRNIDLEVKILSEAEEGDHENAHFLPKLADRLLNDIRWLPLWSSVSRDQFGYGRVPASSAPVESEFNIIKTHLLKREQHRLRPDTFVRTHIEHLSGRIKIFAAQSTSFDAHNVDTPDSNTISSHLDSNGLNGTDDISAANKVTSHYVTEDSSPKHVNATVDDDPDAGGVIDDSFNAFTEGIIKDNFNDTSEVEPADDEYPVASSPIKKPEKTKKSNFCTLCTTAVDVDLVHTTDGGIHVCPECLKVKSTAQILASREIEDWGGLSSTAKKTKSKYLTKNHKTFDAITSDKLTKVPIMKNGNTTTLQASKFGDGKYSFTKTCALDSVIHAILVAAYDRPLVKETINDLRSENPIFDLVMDIMNNGLRAHSYQLRAQILLDINRSIKSVGNIHLIDCEVNVCYVVSRTFLNTPSIREISPCTKGCEYIQKQLRSISVKRCELLDPEKFENILHEVLGTRQGCCAKCKAPTIHQFTATGPFVMMEMDDDVGMLMLDEIPKSFQDPLSQDNCRFRLVGLVDFTPPMTTRSTRTETMEVGHYTTIALRPPNLYFQVDDTKAKPKKLPGTY